MPFDKNSASEAGKKSSRKGKPNKSTAELRELLQTVLEKNIETLESDLQKMEPAQRVNALMNLAGYILPKLKATELTTRDTKIIWNETKTYDKPADWVQSKNWV